MGLEKYNKKLDYFKLLLQNEEYDVFNSKVIKFDFEVPFVYFNIINMLFDFECKNNPEKNEIAINIFTQDKSTYIVFIWEQENNNELSNYFKQLESLDLEDLQYYLTNIIMAFPFNFYITPSIYINWTNKDDFENEIEICAKQFFQYRYYLFNIFLREKKLNIFKIGKI